MTIKIDGLSTEQQSMADILWGLNTQKQVNEFIEALDNTQQYTAYIVMNMMIAATLDQVNETEQASCVLRQYML